MILHNLPIAIILTAVAITSVKFKKLTLPAAITGWLTGFIIFEGAGYTGVAMLAAFFVLATLATSHGMKAKQKLGLSEENKGKRNAGQVAANAGAAAILGLLIVIFPGKADVFRVMIAAAIASATADTLSSELGNVYGKHFYNIITFKKDTRGLDGVVSAEGTLIGFAGSSFIAVVYAAGFTFNIYFLIIIIAGTVGNLSDSVLGATAERKGFLHNNAVNFLNTAIAAFTAGLVFSFTI